MVYHNRQVIFPCVHIYLVILLKISRDISQILAFSNNVEINLPYKIYDLIG
jgi:hypothetical protein